MQMKGDGAIAFSKQTAATTATRLSGVKGPINAIEDKPYRARGGGVFEWTLDELIEGKLPSPNAVTKNQISAELSYRLALLVFILLLPFIAVATIVEPRRNPGPFRFFVGLLVVLGFNQYLSIGANFSSANVISPILTVWLPLLVLIILVAWRFWKISYRPAFKTAR